MTTLWAFMALASWLAAGYAVALGVVWFRQRRRLRQLREVAERAGRILVLVRKTGCSAPYPRARWVDGRTMAPWMGLPCSVCGEVFVEGERVDIAAQAHERCAHPVRA